MLIRFPFAFVMFLSIAAAQRPANFDPQSVLRGKTEFKSSCGFCHGEDATGSRAPDLIRSAIVSHDVNGNLIGPVIHNGRADQGMPAFPNLSLNKITDIVAFLHSQAYEAVHSAHVSGDYPLAKLLTGNAAQGEAYFKGAGGCTACHSASGDFAGIAKKYRPIDLQQRLVYPAGEAPVTADVTLPDGSTLSGEVRHADEFTIAIETKDGWYHSWPRSRVNAVTHDPLEAHRALTEKYTDADMHNLFAYLETLK